MVGVFEMQPSTYHLGECNADVVDEQAKRVRCGQPAVERVIGLGPIEAGGDWRRCEEHLATK